MRIKSVPVCTCKGGGVVGGMRVSGRSVHSQFLFEAGGQRRWQGAPNLGVCSKKKCKKKNNNNNKNS